MKVISIHSGLPLIFMWHGQEVRTSIFKHPIEGPVVVKPLGIESDTQSDLRLHGGQYKAVYAYPSEHYDYWKEQLPNYDFEWGNFGENITTKGLCEEEVAIGDIMRIGSVLLKVTQPRFPCFKLGIRFDNHRIIHKFHKSRKCGFYFEVLEEGSFQKDDQIVIIEKGNGVNIPVFYNAFTDPIPPKEDLKKLLGDPNLIEEWRPYFNDKLMSIVNNKIDENY